MKRRHGFTLIELLVVFGVIGLLTAILLPTFQAARARARSIACIAHLNQIGLALAEYAHDYDDMIPRNLCDPTAQVPPARDGT